MDPVWQRFLEVTDAASESLKQFADWYFDFYPDLFDYIPFKLSTNNAVEIELGCRAVAKILFTEKLPNLKPRSKTSTRRPILLILRSELRKNHWPLMVVDIYTKATE